MNNRLILVEGIYYVLVKVLFKYCELSETVVGLDIFGYSKNNSARGQNFVSRNDFSGKFVSLCCSSKAFKYKNEEPFL